MSLRRVLLRPDEMFGSDTWRKACFKTVSFGDQLGGSTAQLVIADCFDNFVPLETRATLDCSPYMVEIIIGSNDKDNPVKKMITEVDYAFKEGNFEVQSWVKTGDSEKVKFLSYMYNPETDTFNVRPNINWSPRKRGVRSQPNVKTWRSYTIMFHNIH